MESFKKKIRKLVLMYNVIGISLVLLFYPNIPKLLNYPPNSIDNEFQVGINGLTYTQQYLVILAIVVLVENIILFAMNRRLSKLLLNNNETGKKYVEIARILERTPKMIYLLQIVVPIICIIGTFLILNGRWGIILKITFVFFVMVLSSATLSYVFCKGIFKEILIDIFNEKMLDDVTRRKVLNELKRHSIKTYVILTVIPLFIIITVLTTFICYSKSITNNGNNLYNIYSKRINDNIGSKYYSIDEIEKVLKNIEKNKENDGYFILKTDGEKLRGNIYTSDFFIKYITDVAMKNGTNKTYEFYATESEGIFKIIEINDQQYIIGIKYGVSIPEITYTVSVVITAVIIISLIILTYVLTYIFRDITLVTKRLNNMTKSKKIDLSNQIPVSSNDEISDLVKAFTTVQEKTNNYLQQIDQDQYTMQRQAQFAILGEFAGGLAHDLNSPLSAVKLDISTLKKYINSDKIVVGEQTTNKLNEMINNIDKSLNSMGNIIIGVRNQIRATGNEEKEEFLLKDIVEGIKLLFRSILMKNNCQLEYDIPEDLVIYGEKNKLDRVIGNLIKNSIDAYVSINKKGKVIINAQNIKDKIIISIKDEAGGLSEEIQENIFKEIKTTKKVTGTGFGLYYSNIIIESSFKGKMYFDSKKGVGTTFYIEIPNNKEEK